jgi:serine/threonine protein kinase/Tol biopolymer transport system component
LAFTPGTRLGVYEVTALIGEGGMGQVFRARDTKLNRDVALKVLPDSVANDAERLARFRREAQTLASLNHPNIAQIHGLEDSSGVLALVMELVEGDELSQRIGRGPIPIDEALPIARQIAEALEAAHERAIIHRDLKPANIKLRPDGTVKVLDFGLAKAVEPVGPVGGDATASPTITSPAMTQMGLILGTAAYMSPEQAKGQPADKRSDIWSFGAVLHEMLSGRRTFKGDDIADTLAAVLRQDVDWKALPANVPPRLLALLRDCLVRDPKQRLRDIGDARRVLDQIIAGVPDAAAVTAADASSRPRSGLVPWVVAGVTMLAAVAISLVHFQETPGELRLIATSILPPETTSFDFVGDLNPVALSPDGRRVVFGARASDGKSRLWVRRLDANTAQPLPGTEGGLFPFWSHDSRFVAFFTPGKLQKIDITGGRPVMVTAMKGVFRGGAWNRDDIIVFNDGEGPLLRVSAAGGTPAAATVLEKGDSSHRFPWFLPDGKHFLYAAQHGFSVTGTTIRVAALAPDPEVTDPREGTAIGEASTNAIYSQGYMLFAREGTLLAQPFDATRLTTVGEPIDVVEGIQLLLNNDTTGVFSVSEGGLLAYQAGGTTSLQQLTWFDREGKPQGTVGDPGHFVDIELSPSRDKLVVSLNDRASGTMDLWIYDDVRRGPSARFTFDAANETAPIWTAGGIAVVFAKAQGNLYCKPASGVGAEELLYLDQRSKQPTSVSPDGKVLYTSSGPGSKTGSDVWILPMAPGKPCAAGKPYPVLATPFNERQGEFSPDGLWVAYVSDESRRNEVFVAPFPGPGGKRQVSMAGGSAPRWSHDGKEIFYIGPDRRLMAAEVSVKDGALNVVQVRALSVPRIGRRFAYDVSLDSQKFLVPVAPEQSVSAPLTLVQNWTLGLKK